MTDTILFVTASAGKTFGGGKRVFYTLISGLDKKQFRPVVVCSPEGLYARILSQAGITVRHLNMGNRYNLWTIFRLARIMIEESPVIVHSQGGARTNYFTVLAAKLAGVKAILVTVAVIVESYDVSFTRKRIYRFIDRLSERFIDRFIVVSGALKNKIMHQHKIPSEKIVKIYNGIDLRQHQYEESVTCHVNIRNELGLGKDTVLIGAIGRLVWEKGFEYLLEAVSEIVGVIAEAKVLFVGEGPLMDKLKAKSAKLNVKDKIIFAGFRNDIYDLLSSIDLVVVPSLTEGFPMIVLEAMAMAKPIIATSIDGITEQITDGVHGILVPPKDPSALAKAVIRVLNDKELAKTMGLAARKKVEQAFSVEKMIAETEKVYLSLLKAN